MRAIFGSTSLLGAALFLFSAAFPPFDDATEVDLTIHMTQHVLIVIAGAMIAYPHFKRGRFVAAAPGWASKSALALASLAIVVWHLPALWDLAVLSPGVHVAEHFTFLGVGILSGSILLRLSDSAKIGALLAALFGHMAYAVYLILPSSGQVYFLYSAADQWTLGWTLILTGPSLALGIAYVVMRNPDWLSGFGGGSAGLEKRETFLNRIRVPSSIIPIIIIGIVLFSAGYFVSSAYALSRAPSGETGNPTVYISETPVSWQFSPQVIHVVIGVNSTVTWVSHSISYDTVTTKDGTVSSGPIAPGGTFEYRFTAPGVYHYYCAYHPWMTGEVIVG